jgi:hypothetical protein
MSRSATLNEWLLAQRDRGRPLSVTPADELHDLGEQRAQAEAAGDVERVEALDSEIEQARERVDAERREQAAQESARIRHSSGVRRPVVKPPSTANVMNSLILLSSGRDPGLSRRRRRLI